MLYELSSTEGWLYYLYAMTASEGIEMQPKRYWKGPNNDSFGTKTSTFPVILFFIAFMMVGSFFVVNLFVGVVIDNFNQLKAAKEGGGSLFMTEEQIEWSNTRKFVMKLKPKRKFHPPVNKIPKTAWDILHVTYPVSFDIFIMGCILANSG